MPTCPRCKHQVDPASTICTQCGTSIPAEVPPGTVTPPPSLTRTLLAVGVLVLLAILVLAILIYRSSVEQLGR